MAKTFEELEQFLKGVWEEDDIFEVETELRIKYDGDKLLVGIFHTPLNPTRLLDGEWKKEILCLFKFSRSLAEEAVVKKILDRIMKKGLYGYAGDRLRYHNEERKSKVKKTKSAVNNQ